MSKRATKHKAELGEKRANNFGSKPKDGKPSSFYKDKSPYQNKALKEKGSVASGDKSHSQIRRQKIKISDLIKKLRINYNKLLMKKKELEMSSENK